MITFLENIDREILFAINGAHNAFLDHVMWIISADYFGIPIYLLFAYFSYKFFHWKGLALFLIIAGATIGLTDLTAKYLFKEVFLRYRPSKNLEIWEQLHFVNNYRGGQYGFVSSHAANTFAITTLAFLTFRKKFSNYWLLIFLFPVIVSYSRVYLGVHYPSDVICGALLGSFIGWVFYRILNHQLNLNSIK